METDQDMALAQRGEITATVPCNGLNVRGDYSTIYNNCTVNMVNNPSIRRRRSHGYLKDRQTNDNSLDDCFDLRRWITIAGLALVLVIGTLVIIKIRTPEPRGENIQDSFPHSNPLAPESTDQFSTEEKISPVRWNCSHVETYKDENYEDGNVGEDDDLLDLINDVGRKFELKDCEVRGWVLLRLLRDEIVTKGDVRWTALKTVGGAQAPERDSLYEDFEISEEDVEDIRSNLRKEESVVDEVYKVLNHGLRVRVQRTRRYLLRKLFERDENLARSFIERLFKEMNEKGKDSRIVHGRESCQSPPGNDMTEIKRDFNFINCSNQFQTVAPVRGRKVQGVFPTKCSEMT